MKKEKVFRVKIGYHEGDKKLIPLQEVRLPNGQVITLNVTTLPISDPDVDYPLMFKDPKMTVRLADIIIYEAEPKQKKGEVTLLKEKGEN